MTYKFISLILLLIVPAVVSAEKKRTDYVNPFLGTATLWDSKELGYTPTVRAWGGEVFPGSSLPNAMVQLTPVTQYRSGSGYQYEDSVIYGFVHTSKGHWNLCHIPLLPVTGSISPDDFASPFNHEKESAHPGYYQVFLDRYGVNAELTSTLRCAFHKYTFESGKEKKLIADLTRSNEGVRGWEISKKDDYTFTGFQQTGEKMHFYAVANHKIKDIESVKSDNREVSVVNFENDSKALEIQIGFSFVSIENAKENLEKEMLGKSFAQVREEATVTWDNLLSKIKVTGGTEKQKETFYSCLYRSFLWPALRSDINGDFIGERGKLENKGFRFYTDPSFWDDYRNKLVLLGMLSPDVTIDVINSITYKGSIRGFMPTFFHGDHASVFITGSYLRGLRGFDVNEAYRLILKNATDETGNEDIRRERTTGRGYLKEYTEKGYISEFDEKNPTTGTQAKASVTKTLEYAYDDYAVALLAKELNDKENYEMLMKRTKNYKNLFDPSTGFMRGRLENGDWVENFNPEYPYYKFMYREANAWQSTFFAPHDTEGLIELYGSNNAFEKKLDDLFSIPWGGYEAHNLTSFIGQYCHGNQPDHTFPYLYYFIDKQEKSQDIIDQCLEFYRRGKEGLSYPGMDDTGEMSAWYVFNAIGLYTYSPADPEYIITVPVFDKVELWMKDNVYFTITKKGSGKKITDITYGDQKINGYFISHDEMNKGKTLTISTK